MSRTRWKTTITVRAMKNGDNDDDVDEEEVDAIDNFVGRWKRG